MKTALVSYYSRTNHTHKVAEIISKAINADTERVLDAQHRKGILGYIRSGRQAVFKSPGAIQAVKKDASQYDLVVLGTPVWGWNLSPPMRNYVTGQCRNFKRVAFFCTEGGSGGKRIFQQLESLCGKKPVATLEVTEGELKSGEYNRKVQGFIQQLKANTMPERVAPQKSEIITELEST